MVIVKMLSRSSVSIANGLFDLSGGALIKTYFVGLRNRFCPGTGCRRERYLTKPIVSSLNNSSFKKVAVKPYFLEKKTSLF